MLRLLLPSVTLCMLAGSLVATGVRAQTDLDAGKSGPQLFSQDCVACHRSAQGLLKNTSSFGLVGFLRQHYTSSSASANTLAAYLQGVANARPAADPKKGKSADPQQQQAKQTPRDPRAAPPAPATTQDPAQAHVRQSEPPTTPPDHPLNRRQRRPGPAETGATPPPEPTTAARPSAPEPAAPPAPPAPAQQAAAAPQAAPPPPPPPEPGFAEPLP